MKDTISSFIWDPKKELENVDKHGVDFLTAAKAFKDPKRKIGGIIESCGLEC